jgi:prepilin-type N-terminal cleavage/methylation domain-containing protein
MSALDRRGLTLAELVVTLALLGIVTAGICRGLLTSQRTYLAQAQRVELQQNLRAAAAILPAEFRELDAADSDITAMSATSITMRRTEQLGFLCVAPDVRAEGEVTLSVRQRPLFGARSSFSAGDSVLLYVEGDPSTRSDDDWVRGQIIAASSRDCPDPDHARPGYELTLRLQPPGDPHPHPDVRGGVTKGSPLRGFATVTYALYSSPTDNQWYLGQRLAGATIQPLLGPLIGPSGLALSYFDSTSRPTDMLTAVAEVEIRVRGRTALPVRATGGGSAYVVDSLVTRVALRNNPRQ